MTISHANRTAVAVALGALLLAACGTGTGTGTSESTNDAPTVVATTSIWADITANVACDGLAQVQTIIPPGGDPHSFEPSLRDRETMDNADLVITNGLFLEESLADTIDAIESNGVAVLRVGNDLDPLAVGETSHDDHDDHDDEDHDHGDFDPHVWWDPTRVAEAVPVIADALAEVGIDQAALDACADQYLNELTTLDEEIDAIVAALPVDQRILVTNHDSLSYFADRYNFEVLGSVIPSSSSLAATSPGELDALAADIEATGVSAIFADTQNSSTDADALANRIGDVEVISMLTGTLDKPGSNADTYIGWLRTNARTIVDALTRTRAS
jgi:zinc/manganese transport system substrate-binding protein